MAFPSSPTNGQVTVVNQVSYQYSSATNSWTRILSTANVITANTIAVNGALTVGTTISAVGNITGSYFFGNGSQLTGLSAGTANSALALINGTTNLTTATSGNANLTIGGTSNVVVWATTGQYVTGVSNVSGTIAGGNLSTVGFATATGNITGGNLLTGGLVSATGTVTGSTLIGTVVTASGNITGGNLMTGGLISATSTITSGDTITGANLATGGYASAAGNVTGGNVLTGGLISATSTITSAANITGGNLLTGGIVSATGNATFGNISTTGASGNISGANVISSTTLSATANVIGGNVTTGGLITATGNITGGNVLTAGLVSATGNVTGNYILGNGAFLSGVITSVANINNGTSNVTVVSSGGNVTVGIGGTSNIAVFATTGEYVTGIISASGNILSGGNISAQGNITSTNVFTGVVSASGNITSQGYADVLYAISAGGNITGGNVLTGGVVSATANVTGGNLMTGGLISATSTITSGSTITGANLAAGGYASAAGNVTGGNVNTGGLVTATGNISGGNVLTGGLVSATGNVTGGNLVSSVVYGATNVTITAASGTITLNPSGNVLMSSKNINNLADPVADQDAATKVYVDTIAQGLDPKASVLAGTTGTLAAASGGVITYNNGTAGVGATLTTTGTYTTIDGTSIATIGARVLVKNEVTQANNGIYTYANATVLTRAVDMNVWAEVPGAFTFVETGSINADTGWVCTADATGTMGTTAITWTQFSSAGSYSANTSAGLSLIGSQFNALVDGVTTAFDAGGNISVKASANLTTPNIGAATGTSLNVTSFVYAGTVVSAAGNITGGNILTGGLISATSTITSAANITGGNILTAGLVSAAGNVSGNYILGNGAFLSGVITSVANINNGTSNVTVVSSGGNVTVGVGGTGNVAVFATTGEYITGLLSVSGNITSAANVSGGNILTGGLISATANITGGNLLTGGLVSSTGTVTGSTLIGSVVTASGNVTGGNILTGGLISATSTITSAANITGGNLLTGGLVSSTGTVTGSTLIGSVVTASGNITGGNVLTGGLISATSTIISAANISGGNLLTGGLISSTGTVTGSSFLGSVVSVTANVTGGNITSSGLISTSGNIAGGNILTNNYFYANGLAVPPGIVYTANTAPPTTPNPKVTDQWYNTSTDVLYQYLDDGTTDYWVDISSPAFAAGVVANVAISGSLLVNANATYDIGSSVQTFANVYAQNYFGNGSNLTGIDATSIQSGTSNVRVVSSGGNVTTSVGGTSNVIVVSSGLVAITGDLSVSGNATLSGNILGDRIQNGTTTIDIQAPNGNANVTIAGTSNVAVFATSGVFITGVNSVSGNITGGNLTTAGILTVNSGSDATAIVNGAGNATGNIGSSSVYFNRLFAQATTALYADLAENYLGDADYASGTVVDFGGTQEITISTVDSSKRVAGVVSTNPAHLMNAGVVGEHVVTVALIGRVPVSVTGTVRKGDLMVSAGDGTAKAVTIASPKVGTIIGKSLEDFNGDKGTIEIVIGKH